MEHKEQFKLIHFTILQLIFSALIVNLIVTSSFISVVVPFRSELSYRTMYKAQFGLTIKSMLNNGAIWIHSYRFIYTST